MLEVPVAILLDKLMMVIMLELEINRIITIIIRKIIIILKSMEKSKEDLKLEITNLKRIIIVIMSRIDITKILQSTQQSMYQRLIMNNP